MNTAHFSGIIAALLLFIYVIGVDCIQFLCIFALISRINIQFAYTMKNRNDRQEAVCRIIAETDIKNQEQLMNCLAEKGFAVTQATLSRDLKQLKISKVANTYGEYVYVLHNLEKVRQSHNHNIGRVENQPRRGFESITFSGNLAVIKTKPGYAASLAFDIDSNHIPNVLGTIAGDDTLLMILAEDASAQEIKRKLEPILTTL